MEELQENPTNEPQTSPDRPTTESQWQVWLREKRGLLLKTTAAVIPAAVLTLAIIRGCDDAESPANATPTPTGPSPTETFTPEPTATQVVEITPTVVQETPAPQPTETPAPAETQTPQNVYETINQNIENSQLEQAQKTQVEQQLAQLEQIESTRHQFIDYYKSQTDENGQPVLLALVKQKYASVDPSQLEGFDPQNPNAAYENTIFFMRDEQKWNNTTKPILLAIQNESDGSIIAQKVAELVGQNMDQSFYLEANTKNGLNLTISVEFTPQSPEEQRLLEQTQAHINSLKDQLPLFGNIQFRINNSNNNGHNYSSAEDKTVINITLENPAISAPIPPTHVDHEAIHALDCADVTYTDQNGQRQTMENSIRCVRYFPPEKVVDALIARETFLANLTVGRKYPMRLTPSESFQIQVLNSQITAEDAARLANDYATQRYEQWADNSPQQRTDRTDSEVIAQFGAVRSVFDAKLIKDQNTQLFDSYIDIFRNN